MTIAEAKARAQQLEDDIVALIPADIIKTTDQLDKARLMNCTGGVTWPGSTVITFTEPQDADAIVQKLHDDLDKTENAGNTIEQVDNDYLLATYITTDGATALIAEEAGDGTSIRIDSNSPCFELPEGSSRHGKY
ncbi:hypothetical protein [Orlajensenia leifsoniae]|uniref:Uncharacterized protein n=1 Tax=Orlajensenia leifsoniae TaxID=2561933 RepID=A0A4Y9RAT9_9MICO|nr:hypothetical protein [Leifsonia flava]TFW00196.1 hypothetical protein E4M00_03140 [Leifsonia flava]